MPIKIALVGAPGAGKTELANQIESALDGVTVVDNYIKEIEERCDLVFGHFATHIGNALVATGRFEAERKAEKENPEILVTCGSVIETCVYTAIYGFVSEQTRDWDLKEIQQRRAGSTMMWLGMFAFDTMDHDHIFYLPLSDEEKEDDERKWDLMVDQNIIESAEAMNYRLKTLSTNRDDRLAEVLQEVESVKAAASN